MGRPCLTTERDVFGRRVVQLELPLLRRSFFPLGQGGFFRFCRGQAHPDQFADAAFFHRHSVKDVRFRDRALVVRDDDELALANEALEHPDETIDVRFVERRIHFVEDAEGTRTHHVNGEEKCDRRHCALAAGEERNALQLFARRFRNDVDAAIERVVFVEQDEIGAAAAE